MDSEDNTANIRGKGNQPPEGVRQITGNQAIAQSTWRWHGRKLYSQPNDPVESSDLYAIGIPPSQVRLHGELGQALEVDGTRDNLSHMKRVLEKQGKQLPAGAEQYLERLNKLRRSDERTFP